MGLKICSIGSGSQGNCTFISSGKTKILVDAGIKYERIGKSLKVLGEDTDNLNVLITHTHTDHIGGLYQLTSKTHTKVYAHASHGDLSKKGKVKINQFSFQFTVGDILVTPFLVPHDSPCYGFTLQSGHSVISILTDLGEITSKIINHIKYSDIVFIESNHCENLLKNGSYPPHLKQRILSSQGHLSNTACAEACVELALGKAKQIILGHLSQENNYPELAFNTVKSYLADEGIIEGKDVKIEVASQDKMSGLYEIL